MKSLLLACIGLFSSFYLYSMETGILSHSMETNFCAHPAQNFSREIIVSVETIMKEFPAEQDLLPAFMNKFRQGAELFEGEQRRAFYEYLVLVYGVRDADSAELVGNVIGVYSMGMAFSYNEKARVFRRLILLFNRFILVYPEIKLSQCSDDAKNRDPKVKILSMIVDQIAEYYASLFVEAILTHVPETTAQLKIHLQKSEIIYALFPKLFDDRLLSAVLKDIPFESMPMQEKDYYFDKALELFVHHFREQTTFAFFLQTVLNARRRLHPESDIMPIIKKHLRKYVI